MKLTIHYFILICSMVSIYPSIGFSDCGDAERKTPIYQAFENCESARAAKSVTVLSLYLKRMTENGYCTTLGNQDHSQISSQLCSDPSGFVCSQAHANLFSSQCEFWPSDTKNVANTPAYVTDKCTFEARQDSFLKSHQSECEAGMEKSDCDSWLKLTHQQELSQAERDVIYSPVRVDRLQTIFKRVMETYIKAITATKLIPEAKKVLVLAQLNATRLEVPPSADQPPACTNTEPSGPDSGIYNSEGHIIFCIGAIALLDHVNEYDLIHTMAHEISHSIDPCTLEFSQSGGSGAPHLGRETYPALLECLRGGKNRKGCGTTILNCNSSHGIQEALNEQLEDFKDQPLSVVAEKRKELTENFRRTPDCPIGKSDVGYDGNNLADYRKDSQPVDQMSESFADFMGAEIVGRIASQNDSRGAMDAIEKEDALETIASDYSRLHGGCRKENTHDPHPPGFIRVNRVIMGSEVFRKSMGCAQKPPSTPGAALTCRGL